MGEINLNALKNSDKAVYDSVMGELKRQKETVGRENSKRGSKRCRANPPEALVLPELHHSREPTKRP